ncbi:MAG: HD-GYP domain-containing protein [Planctomycetota bacterium]|jgi:putative nucleotidyltransferase with HDIG domain
MMTTSDIRRILLIEPDGPRQALVLMALLEACPEAAVEPVSRVDDALAYLDNDVCHPLDCILVGQLVDPNSMVRLLNHEVVSDRAVQLQRPLIVRCLDQHPDDTPRDKKCRQVARIGSHDWLRADQFKAVFAERIGRCPSPTAPACWVERHQLDEQLHQPASDPQGHDSKGRRALMVIHSHNRDRLMCISACLERWSTANAQEIHRQRPTLCAFDDTAIAAVIPGDSLARAISMAEALMEAHEEAACCDNLDDTGVGLAVEPFDVPARILVERAEAAARFAREQSVTRVMTWEMVRFHGTAVTMSPHPEQVEDRVQALLDRWNGDAGPTKHKHLTSHARFVSRMAVRLGKSMGLDEEVIERLRAAGLFHDIGKLLIPESVLAKNGRLSEDERVLLMRHADDGAQMALALGADHETAGMIQFHHARYDRANQGEDGSMDCPVPLGARILAVADAFVTMTSHRPYQRARTFTEAVHELRVERGRQFCPQVVDAIPSALSS